MNATTYQIGDLIAVKGSRYATQVVNVDGGIIEARRVDPTTGELEGGEPLRFVANYLDASIITRAAS